MNSTARPVAVTAVAWLYVAIGTIGFIAHFVDFVNRHAPLLESVEIEAVEVVAIVSGIFLLRGSNWARWLALAWIAFHVTLSFGEVPKLIVHALFCALIAWALFHRRAAEYFTRASA